MSLREEIMARLRDAGNAADTTDDFRWNCERALPGLADECIRQMEWAWRQGHTAADCDQTQAIYEEQYFRWAGRYDDVTGAEEYPLSAAPEGWKP